jgi:hypothetical protein
MLTLYKKDKKKKKSSRTVLYGLLKIQNHQVTNLKEALSKLNQLIHKLKVYL